MAFVLNNALSPLDGESLPGLIMRNAQTYRFINPTRLARRLTRSNVMLQTLCRENPSSRLGQGLRHLLGLDEEAWEALSMWDADETMVHLRGHQVWIGLVGIRDRTVCPQCLAESQHHRAIWVLDSIPVCARHACRLISACPQCTKPLRWHGVGIHRCGNRQCNFDLRRASPMKVPGEEMNGIIALDRLFRREMPEGSAPLGLAFSEVLRLTITLGHEAMGMERINRLSSFISRERERMPAIIEAGWQALDDWPRGFHRLLEDKRKRASERGGKAGLRKAFGSLSSRIFHWGREPWGAPFAQAFGEYIAAQDDLAVSTYVLKRYVNADALKDRHMSMGEASRALGVSAGTMQRFAENRDLFVVAPNGPGVPSMIRADTVRRMQDEMRDFMLPDEAREALNVGPTVFVKLEDAGVINRVPEAERVLESRPFRRSTIEALAATCRGDTPEITKDEARQRGLWRLAGTVTAGRQAPDVVRALAEGRLRAAALVRGETGIRGIRFVPGEVERAVPAQKGTMSAVEAGSELKVHYRHVLFWARQGLLGTTQAQDRDELGMRFSHANLDAFTREYLTGGELSRLDGNNGNGAMTRHLRYLGIKPISGPKVDEGETTVFRRSDVTPEVLQRVARIRQRKTVKVPGLRQLGFARVAMAAEVIADTWGATFRRMNNRFTCETTGRIVQVVSGRRPDLTGVFLFTLNRASLAVLHGHRDPYVAMVPNEGPTFLLVPLAQVKWRGTSKDRHITIRFDGAGEPVDLADCRMPLATMPAPAA